MDELNYFDLLGLPFQFDVDTQALEQNYKTLIANWHPDKFATKTDFEKKQAMMMASKVNDAYQILMYPLNRAAFMLKLNGLDADSQTDTNFASNFLMQQMQWREDLETFLEEKNKQALQALFDEIKDTYQKQLDSISLGFKEGRLEETVSLVRQGRFMDKMLNQVKTYL